MSSRIQTAKWQILPLTSIYQDGKPFGEDLLETKAVIFDTLGSVPTLILRKDGEPSAEPYFGSKADGKGKKRHTLYANFKMRLESADSKEREQAREDTKAFLAYMAEEYKAQRDGGHLGIADSERTIISYPVKWNAETKAFMREAAKEAGFPNVEVMNEAEAAIHAVTVQNAHYLMERKLLTDGVPVQILLIDMGAGTTDLALCRHTPGRGAKTEVLNTHPKSGNILFGGGEADTLLRNYIREKVPEEFTDRVMKRCVAETFKTWKERTVSPALQRDESVSSCAPADDILDILGEELKPFCLDRQEFETCAEAYLRQFPQLVAGCVRESGLSGGDVDLVILTGGHSQWYFVKEMLCGNMTRFGEIDLPKIRENPARLIPVSRPQETVALGLVYSPMDVSLESLSSPPTKTQKPKTSKSRTSKTRVSKPKTKSPKPKIIFDFDYKIAKAIAHSYARQQESGISLSTRFSYDIFRATGAFGTHLIFVIHNDKFHKEVNLTSSSYPLEDITLKQGNYIFQLQVVEKNRNWQRGVDIGLNCSSMSEDPLSLRLFSGDKIKLVIGERCPELGVGNQFVPNNFRYAAWIEYVYE